MASLSASGRSTTKCKSMSLLGVYVYAALEPLTVISFKLGRLIPKLSLKSSAISSNFFLTILDILPSLSNSLGLSLSCICGPTI